MNLKIICKFLAYLKPYIKKLIFMFLAIIINQACSLLLPMFMSRLVDVGIRKNGIESESLREKILSLDQIIFHQTSYILKVGGVMLIITLISILLSIYIDRTKTKISSSLSSNIRQDIFHKVMKFSYSKSSEFSSSSLMTRVTSDVEEVQNFIMLITQLAIPPIMMIGGTIMAIATDASMILIVILIGIICGGIVFGGMKAIASRADLLKKSEDKFNLIIKNQLAGIKVIRSFGNEHFESEKFKESNLKLTKISLFVSNVTVLMSPMLNILSNFLTVYILFIGSAKVNCGEMKVGEVIAFMQYTFLILGSFVMISLIFSMIPRSFVSMQRIFEILNSKTENKNIDRHLELKSNMIKSIEFKNVSFCYAVSSKCALKNLSFKIDSGSTVAIIGGVGSGKSSLLKLILGFYDATSGIIEFQGKNIRDFKKEDILKNISYIPQNPFLFSGTIGFNLKLGNLNAKEDEMKLILKLVQLDGLIKDQGLETYILQSGTNLSGGQKQRLAIARGIIKKAEIYIFDDSFSSLDFKTEFFVRNAILNYLKNKTVFLVSQRIGTIKNADKIIVLDEGKIASIGTHKELIYKCEIYREMFEKQIGSEL